ncbi:LPS-assembly protein LptD [Methylococcus sp. EFPC2]|uniref:LPS-assembly protein LptD n=1 Tax=Methylococcus sp. EFPC2 TaxID=2812648 RepID=UPI001968071A|nr:LPS assembly protein LptD [Methylococcus sp. EFPC2]QSA98254.1 LPS assembly protein LptD [Methylococcus sp. EFPC2]
MSSPIIRRSTLALLLSPWAGSALAATGWDCQRGGADGKEWVCVTGKKKAETPAPGAETERTPVEPVRRAETPRAVARPEPPPAPAAAPTPTPPAKSEPRIAAPVRPVEKPAEPVKRLSGVTAPPLPATVGTKPASAEKPGWTCKASPDRAWECGLVGADPRGQAHRVGEAGEASENWAAAETMTDQDELRFKSIMARLPEDPWRLSCGKHKSEITPSTLFLMTEEDRLLRESTPLEIESDAAELVGGEVSNFKGSADLLRADQRLSGDFVTHNNASGALSAQGNVLYREKGLSFAADTAYMKMKTDEGVLRNSQFVIETVPARGTSRLTHIDSKTVSRYDTVSYTTCPPGDQSWMIHADKAEIDKGSGRGLARNAWLEFKGVPILWTPVMSFPVDDRRQSGFLTPNFAYTKVGGFDFSIPYYLNLSPNYDATVWLREITNRGQLVRGEFRYLTEMTRGVVGGEYMPHDDVRQSSRGLFTLKNQTQFNESISSLVDLNYVTDPRYLSELGNVLHVQNSRFMRSNGSVTYQGEGYAATASADHYLSIDPLVTQAASPYSRLPQLTFNSGHGVFDTGLIFETQAEVVNFAHRAAEDRVTAQRLNLRPRLYYPLRGAAGYITPSFALQYTQYWMSWPDTGSVAATEIDRLKALNGVASIRNDVSRTAPVFSVDSGLYFDREFDLAEKAWTQTLEPRLFYLYRPKIDQTDIPIFDSAEYDFNFYQLFRDNGFAGTDRLSDANQITPAVTTRFIDHESGLERLKLSVGEVFYFRDREVNLLPTTTAKTSGRSNLVGELSSALTDVWRLRTTGQWNPTRSAIDRSELSLQYNDRRNQLLNLSYRYRRDPNLDLVRVEQTDASFRLPFAEGWNVIGRWQYSLLNQVTTETFFGVERETCCWRFSLIGLRYLNGSSTGSVTSDAQVNNGIFFQLEFKGLTRLGNEVDQFLSRSITGYRLENEF